MSYVVSFDEAAVGPWVSDRWDRAIGLYKGKELVAAAVFEGYNGRNMDVHIRISDPWATGPLLKLIGRYAFGQLGLQRLTLWAESSNISAVKFHRRLGAVLEGRLVEAGSNGDDILIFRLTPNCKFWRRWNGKESPATPAA